MRKLFSAVLLALFVSVGAFAQAPETAGRIVEQAEFETLHRNSFRWRAGKAYREIRIDENTAEMQPHAAANGVPAAARLPRTTVTKSTAEHLPGVGTRWIFEFNSGSLNSKTERISIAGKIYVRKNDGAWSVESLSAAPPPVGEMKTIYDKIEYRFLGNEKLDGQNAVVYAKIERTRITGLKNQSELLSNRVRKHWFGEDGRLLKTETETEMRSELSTSRSKMTESFELDPNIKISAPILN